MQSRKSMALVISALVGVSAACGAGGTTDTGSAAAGDDQVAATASTAEPEATAPTSESTTGAANPATGAQRGRQGPGGEMSASSVSSVDDLVALIQEAYGDPGLGLQRGHRPVESTLVDVLGISHDEMHVRMETQGQNLAAVATDVGVEPQTLIDALVDSWSPAIDSLLDAGAITQDEADAYHAALQEAFTFRVTWNGEDATPTFSGLA